MEIKAAIARCRRIIRKAEKNFAMCDLRPDHEFRTNISAVKAVTDALVAHMKLTKKRGRKP